MPLNHARTPYLHQRALSPDFYYTLTLAKTNAAALTLCQIDSHQAYKAQARPSACKWPSYPLWKQPGNF